MVEMRGVFGVSLFRVQKEFPDDIIVIAIDRDESIEKIITYTDSVGVSDDLVFLLDDNDSFYRAIGGFSMPETIFVNDNGDIVFHKRGFMDLKEMREHTLDALKTNSN